MEFWSYLEVTFIGIYFTDFNLMVVPQTEKCLLIVDTINSTPCKCYVKL